MGIQCKIHNKCNKITKSTVATVYHAQLFKTTVNKQELDWDWTCTGNKSGINVFMFFNNIAIILLNFNHYNKIASRFHGMNELISTQLLLYTCHGFKDIDLYYYKHTYTP